MPTYTPGQKKYILQNEGYDPAQYDLDDGGNVIPLGVTTNQESPSPISNPIPQIPQAAPAPSQFDTFRRSVTENIVPTIAGLAATGGAAYLTGGMSLIPQLLAGTAAGVAGSVAGSKAQDAVVSDETRKEYFLRPEDEANPWTRAAGSLVPQAIQMNPVAGVKNLASIAGKVPNMVRNPMFASKALTDRDTQALINAGAGAGIGGGVNAGMQLASGQEEFSIPELLTSVAGGAVFNAPWNNRLNKALGTPALPEGEAFVPDRTAIPQTWQPDFDLKTPSGIDPYLIDKNNQVGKKSKVNPLEFDEALKQGGEVQIPKSKLSPEILDDIANQNKDRTVPQSPEDLLSYKEAVAKGGETIAPQLPKSNLSPELLDQITQLKASGITPEELLGYREALIKGGEVTAPQLPKPILSPDIVEKGVNPEVPISREESELLGYKEALTKGGEVVAPQLPASNLSAKILREGTKTKKDWRYNEKELLTGQEVAIKKTLPGNRLSTLDEAADTSNSLPISNEARDIASRRGVNISDEPTLPTAIRGVENYEARQVRLNPKNADTSTLGHEAIGHTFVDDLMRSTDPRDVQLVAKARENAKRLGAKTEGDIQEFIANSVGDDFQRRMKLRLSGSFKDKFVDWTNDIKAYLNYRKGADDSSASGMIAKRGLTDAPYGTRKELNSNALSTARGSIRSSSVRESGSNEETPSQDGIGEGANRKGSTDLTDSIDSGNSASRATRDSSSESNSPEGGEVRRNEEVNKNTTQQDNPISSSLPKSNISEEAAGLNPSLKGNRYSLGKGGEETPKKVEATENKKTEKEYKPASIPGLRSNVDAIEAATGLGEKRHPIAKSFRDFAEKFREYSGKYKDLFLYDMRDKLGLKFHLSGVKDWLTGDNIRSKRVLQYLDDMQDHGKSSITLDSKDMEIVKDIRKMMKQVREDQNSRPGLKTDKGEDPNYFPQNIKPSALYEMINNPDTALGKKYNKLFVDYVGERIKNSKSGKKKNLTIEQARKEAEVLLSNFKKASSSGEVNIAKQFGPIDKAVGYGLPPELRETNLSARLSHYLDRTARRFAHHDTIESRPEVQDALFGNDALIGAQPVKNAYNKIAGIRSAPEAIFEGLTGILKSTVTGTVAGLRDVITTPILGAQHQTFFQVPRTAIKALANLKENWRESFGQGLNKIHIGALESGDVSGGFPGAENLMRRVRDISNEAQLRTWLEQLSRTWAYSQGKILASENLVALKRGNASSQQKRFLDNFGPEGLSMTKDLEISDSMLKSIASRYAESVAGTYDIRGLPNWAMEGPIAPVFTLGRWNLEKANNFIKYAIDPIKKDGDFRPLLNQTAWLLLAGGTTMEAFNELVTNKKSKLPSVSEIQSSREMGGDFWKAIGYRAAGLAAVTGFAGELANIAKIAADSHYKNPNKWYNIMLVEFADKARKYIPELASAVARKDPEQTLEILNDFGQEYSQTWRVLMRQVSKEKKDELLRQDENRDVRVFKQLLGKDLGELPGDNVKDYAKEPIRKFKQSNTPEEAFETFPEALDTALEGKDNPEEIKDSLSGLKTMSYRGFPSMDNSPIEAAEFSEFLSKTQGGQKASDRVREAMYMKELNKKKRSLVPSP